MVASVHLGESNMDYGEGENCPSSAAHAQRFAEEPGARRGRLLYDTGTTELSICCPSSYEHAECGKASRLRPGAGE